MTEKTFNRTKQKVVAKYRHNGRGIVTGPHNPASIGCNMFILEDGESATFFKLNGWHEGHKMMAHGGITAAILDEVMGYSNHAREYVEKLGYTPVFTGTVTYKYLKPVMCEKVYYAAAKIYKIEGRKRFIRGAIFDEEGTEYVTGEGIFLTAPALEDSKEMIAYQPLGPDDPEMI